MIQDDLQVSRNRKPPVELASLGYFHSNHAWRGGSTLLETAE
jgi:hypothetical protein